jgi:DNA replication initiation complex subunit (GINS family)
MEIITYETIGSAQRAEREEILQELPDNFFESVREWFVRKEKLKDITSLLEVENANKLMEDLINRRQKKIVLAALRTERGQLPPQNLTDEERKIFDEIVKSLKAFKNNMNEKFKGYGKIAEEKIQDAKKTIKEMKPSEPVTTPVIEETIEMKPIKPNGKHMVKILKDLPRFVGPNLKSYGPLKVGDIITLSKEMSELFINRKIAENILE